MRRTLHIAPPPCLLIINADDLGVSPARDAGILACFSAGAISSASLLVDGASAAQAATAALAADLPLGLHLNLSDGALAGKNSLTDRDGKRLGKFGLREALAAGTIRQDELVAEIRRQFERFIALTGELPSHVDGHHHIHVEPLVAAALAPIMAREYGVYCVRLPREAGLDTLTADAEFEANFQRGVARAAMAAAAAFADEGIYSTDAFIGQSAMGSRLTPTRVGKLLAALPERCTAELMAHPGQHTDDADSSAFCRAPARAHEAAALQSAEFAAARAGWKLASYRDLRRPAPDGDAGTRPNLLIYGKLTPATGNAETARRYAEAWRDKANVRFRPLPADDAPASLAREVRRLREFAWRERLDLALGIHLYRAGGPLAAAFSGDSASPLGKPGIGDSASPLGKFGIGDSASPLAWGLLASGTDANADIDDPARRAVMRAAVRGADFLLCLTEELRERLSALPLPADCTVLPNGIDVRTASYFSLRRELGLADDTPLILLPAALRRLKGVLPTMEALAPLLATHYPAHVLVVLGPTLEADYGAEIVSRIAALVAAHPPLAGRIVLHPGLPRGDYLAALGEADLVLNASEHEGLSHALAEAMACGTPVLARGIAGNRALVRDGENGRLFADFLDLPRAYAACFAAPAETARLAAAARQDIAARFPATAEQTVLRAVLERWQARRQVPVANLRLDLAPGTHPVSAENQQLFAQLALSPALLSTQGDFTLAADIGCGCGVFGAHLLAAVVRSGRRVQHMLFADPHRASLAALERSLLRHAGQAPLPAQATLSDGSLLDPLLDTDIAPPADDSGRATLICANLPQTPGPAGFRLDRSGGADGAELICRFLADLPRALAVNGEAFLLHIGLAHPARVARMIADIGLVAEVLAAQWRHAGFADYEALQPGLADYLRAEQAAGRAEFVPDADGTGFTFSARLLRLRRAG